MIFPCKKLGETLFAQRLRSSYEIKVEMVVHCGKPGDYLIREGKCNGKELAIIPREEFEKEWVEVLDYGSPRILRVRRLNEEQAYRELRALEGQ